MSACGAALAGAVSAMYTTVPAKTSVGSSIKSVHFKIEHVAKRFQESVMSEAKAAVEEWDAKVQTIENKIAQTQKARMHVAAIEHRVHAQETDKAEHQAGGGTLTDEEENAIVATKQKLTDGKAQLSKMREALAQKVDACTGSKQTCADRLVQALLEREVTLFSSIHEFSTSLMESQQLLKLQMVTGSAISAASSSSASSLSSVSSASPATAQQPSAVSSAASSTAAPVPAAVTAANNSLDLSSLMGAFSANTQAQTSATAAPSDSLLSPAATTTITTSSNAFGLLDLSNPNTAAPSLPASTVAAAAPTPAIGSGSGGLANADNPTAVVGSQDLLQMFSSSQTAAPATTTPAVLANQLSQPVKLPPASSASDASRQLELDLEALLDD